MKIDVLSIGSFPAATNAELAKRFAITHHFNRPAPDALGAELKARIRALTLGACRDLARRALQLGTAAEVRALVKEVMP